MPLATPVRKLTISNVPPFIKDETLINQLTRHGKIVSQIKKFPSGCRSPLLQHLVSQKKRPDDPEQQE